MSRVKTVSKVSRGESPHMTSAVRNLRRNGRASRTAEPDPLRCFWRMKVMGRVSPQALAAFSTSSRTSSPW